MNARWRSQLACPPAHALGSQHSQGAGTTSACAEGRAAVPYSPAADATLRMRPRRPAAIMACATTLVPALTAVRLIFPTHAETAVPYSPAADATLRMRPPRPAATMACATTLVPAMNAVRAIPCMYRVTVLNSCPPLTSRESYAEDAPTTPCGCHGLCHHPCACTDCCAVDIPNTC